MNLSGTRALHPSGRVDIWDPAQVGVHIEASATNKPEQRHPALAGQIDRQARWCPDGGQHRNARECCLLHQLKTDPAAHQHDASGQRHAVRQKLRPDQLVQRVVPADIFAQGEQPAIAIE